MFNTVSFNEIYIFAQAKLEWRLNMNNWIICLALAYSEPVYINSVGSIMICIKLVDRLLESHCFNIFH